MRSFLYIILAFSPFICAFPEVDLLLPGIHDQKLQAGILSEENNTRTYLVTFMETGELANPKTRQNTMTAISAPDSFQLISAVNKERTALLSCDISSTTATSCHASVGELQVRGTLKSKDLNWTPVPVTTSYEDRKKNGDPTSSPSYCSAARETAVSQGTSSNTVPAVNEPFSKERKSSNDSVLLNAFRLASIKLFQDEETSEPFMTEVLYTSGFAMLMFAYSTFFSEPPHSLFGRTTVSCLSMLCIRGGGFATLARKKTLCKQRLSVK
ncbi:hypothetical protein DTO280E4_9138 [Paecilomyces variotii]|nr:hypothetical protein DTO021C3_8958 [Paecilomyces variotii]KAJ9349137.1 hypothetical protein DTO280E4_9138 [Paecilomyces variotii]